MSDNIYQARIKELSDKHFYFGSNHNWFNDSDCPTCKTIRKLKAYSEEHQRLETLKQGMNK